MDSHSGIKNELTLMVGKSCFATLGSANSFGIRVGALTSKGRSVCYFGSTGDGCCTWLFHIKQKHGIHQHVFLFPTQRNQLSPDVRRSPFLSRKELHTACFPFAKLLYVYLFIRDHSTFPCNPHGGCAAFERQLIKHTFLHTNIQHSTFHHPPAKTGLSIVWKSKIS